MPELRLFTEQIESVFQLLGQKENDISYSVGYSLANCKTFLGNFLKVVGVEKPVEMDNVKIQLQTYEKEKGYTDFEIILEDQFHLIIEAKRGWNFPLYEQLEKYVTKPSFLQAKAKLKKVIIFNESTPAYTQAQFGMEAIHQVPIQVLSWRDVQQIALDSTAPGRTVENRILKELSSYLKIISTMQNIDSNKVYVVSLGSNKPKGWEISWKEVVTDKHQYFHPVGGGKGGWPLEPPNYIAFRYSGKLQSIHHIDRYEVFNDPNRFFPEIPSQQWEPHYLYHLGPAIKPPHEVKSGKRIVMSMRVWAMLDLLLTCNTIEEARDKTKERESQAFIAV